MVLVEVVEVDTNSLLSPSLLSVLMLLCADTVCCPVAGEGILGGLPPFPSPSLSLSPSPSPSSSNASSGR